MGLLDALEHVGGFDHGACDALLRAQHIDVGINLSQGGDAAIYGESLFFLAWTALLFVTTWRAFRGERFWEARPRWGGVFGCAWGIFLCVLQIRQVGEYVTTCRAVMHTVGT